MPNHTDAEFNPELMPTESRQGNLYSPHDQSHPNGKKKHHGRRRSMMLSVFLGISDLLFWFLIYFGISILTGSYNLISPHAVLLPIAVLMISISLIGGFSYRTDFASLRYASEHLIACLFAYPAAAFVLYVVASFGSEGASSRAIFSVAFVGFAIISLFIRRLSWFARKQSREHGKFIVVVDDRAGPIFFRDYSRSSLHHEVEYVAASDLLTGKHVDGEGTPIIQHDAAQIFLNSNHLDNVHNEAIILACDVANLDPQISKRLGMIHFDMMPVYTMEAFYLNYYFRVPLKLIGPAWPLEAEFLLVQHSAYSAIKRSVDFVVSLISLIALFPIMVLVGIAIWLIERFPPLYHQERMGLHQRPFRLYKFQTMPPGSDKGDCYTREGDRRVSRFGGMLRKTRLDELPQLWNVLKGEMSIIGPRAEWVRLVENYDAEIPFYHFRHLVRPGITGWAQVNYPYGSSLEDARQKFSFDLYYIRNFSMKLDAAVLLKTLYVITSGKGR